jgi:uncharacterized protein YchJ
MKEIECYCGSQLNFNDCCNRYINGSQIAATAEALMRSRYSAYATHNELFGGNYSYSNVNIIIRKTFLIGPAING